MSQVGFTFSDESKRVLRDLFTKYPPHYLEASNKIENKPINNHARGKCDEFVTRHKVNKQEIADRVTSLVAKVQQDDKLRQIHEKVSKLPITKFRDIITSTVESNQVMLISGKTGCGKTTQVPQFFLDHMWAKGETCKVVCSQPRRIATISAAQRVSSERGEKCGNSVGYKVRFGSAGNEKSSILFCTNDVLLKILVLKGSNFEENNSSGTIVTDSFSQITHIIVDEIHERDQFTDLALAILRDILPSYPNLRLILMSATINVERFSEYFGGCPIVKVPGFTYPVTSFYLEDILALLSSNDQAVNKEKHLLLEEYASTSNPEKVDEDLIVKLVIKICATTESGAILVFLPGWNEIVQINKRLISRFSKVKGKYNILCLHSMVPADDQEKVFISSPEGCRKIVLSTNVAETSVTIDDVAFVIDSGKEIENNYDPHNNTSMLNSVCISKANARQRQERAGRCQPGICYNVYSRNVADSMVDFQIPEIQRISIEELCLQVKILDPDCELEEWLQRTLDPPVPRSIQNAIMTLQDIGALSSEEELTDLGKKIALLPLRPQISKMLLVAILTSCLDPALTLAVTSDYKDIFALPLDHKHVISSKINLSRFYGGYSDHLAVVAAYEVFKINDKTGDSSKICKQYHISVNMMRTVINMREELESELQRIWFVPKNKDHLNLNSRYQGVVCAVLLAAQYPTVGRIITKSTLVKSSGGSIFHLREPFIAHMLEIGGEGKKSGDKSVQLIVYDEVVKKDSGLVTRNCSTIATLVLLLLAAEIIVDPSTENMGKSDVMSNPCNMVYVIVDRWIRFELTAIDAAQIYWLRKRLSDAITFMANSPTNELPKLYEDSLRAITLVLSIDGKRVKNNGEKSESTPYEKSDEPSCLDMNKVDSSSENSSDPKAEDTCQNPSAEVKTELTPPKISGKRNRKKKKKNVASLAESSSDPKSEDACQIPPTGEDSDKVSCEKKSLDPLAENSLGPKSEDTCQNPPNEENSQSTPQENSGKRSRRKKRKLNSLVEDSSCLKLEDTYQNSRAGKDTESTHLAKSDEPSRQDMITVYSPFEISSDQKSETCRNPSTGENPPQENSDKCSSKTRKRKKKVELSAGISDPKSEDMWQIPRTVKDTESSPLVKSDEPSRQNMIIVYSPVEISSDQKLETCQNPSTEEKHPEVSSGKRSRKRKKKVDPSAGISDPKSEDMCQNPHDGKDTESTPLVKSEEPSRQDMIIVYSPFEISSDPKSETCQIPSAEEKPPQENSDKRSHKTRKRKKKEDPSARIFDLKSEDMCQNPHAEKDADATPVVKSGEPSRQDMIIVYSPLEISSHQKSETCQIPSAEEKPPQENSDKHSRKTRKRKNKVDTSAGISDPKSEFMCQNPRAGKDTESTPLPCEISFDQKLKTRQNPTSEEKPPQENSGKCSRKRKKKVDSSAGTSDVKSEDKCQSLPAEEKSDEPSSKKMKKVKISLQEKNLNKLLSE